jgi:protein involved in polysaccharide export with SLBB domain
MITAMPSSHSCRFVQIRGPLLLLVLLATHASASPATQPVNPAGTIAPGDLIEVFVADLLGPGKVTPLLVRADEAGRVSLPMVGAVDLNGQTTDAAGTVLSKAYQSKQVIANGIVTVAIRERGVDSAVKPGPAGPGDTFQISIGELTGPGSVTTLHAQIAPDGTIELPLAGKLKVAGLTDAEIDVAVAKRYKEKSIVANAIISTLRTSSAAR